MNLLKRLNEYFAFTKNEQKVFLFLALVTMAGVAVKVYKVYIVPAAGVSFDYSRSDSLFTALSLSAAADSGRADAPVPRKVRLNSATKSELMTLPGIGEATAERILLYREERGKFRTLEELKNVKGIGEKKFEKLKPHIEVQ